MKNLKKYVILSVVVILAVLTIAAKGVNASSEMLFGTRTDTTNTTNTTNTVENTVNTVKENTTIQLNTTTENVARVNNINEDVDKDLPQTGENDIYIVTAIGTIALVIGGVAYIRSRKYNV